MKIYMEKKLEKLQMMSAELIRNSKEKKAPNIK